MTEAKFTKGAETLASLAYTRTPEGLLTKTLNKSLPGEENTESAYDNNDRLTKGASTSYEYDAANNPTKLGTGTYKYNENDELETGPSLKLVDDLVAGDRLLGAVADFVEGSNFLRAELDRIDAEGGARIRPRRR